MSAENGAVNSNSDLPTLEVCTCCRSPASPRCTHNAPTALWPAGCAVSCGKLVRRRPWSPMLRMTAASRLHDVAARWRLVKQQSPLLSFSHFPSSPQNRGDEDVAWRHVVVTPSSVLVFGGRQGSSHLADATTVTIAAVPLALCRAAPAVSVRYKHTVILSCGGASARLRFADADSAARFLSAKTFASSAQWQCAEKTLQLKHHHLNRQHHQRHRCKHSWSWRRWRRHRHQQRSRPDDAPMHGEGIDEGAKADTGYVDKGRSGPLHFQLGEASTRNATALEDTQQFGRVHIALKAHDDARATIAAVGCSRAAELTSSVGLQLASMFPLAYDGGGGKNGGSSGDSVAGTPQGDGQRGKGTDKGDSCSHKKLRRGWISFVVQRRCLVTVPPRRSVVTSDLAALHVALHRSHTPRFDVFAVARASGGRPLRAVGMFCAEALGLTRTLRLASSGGCRGCVREGAFERLLSAAEDGYQSCNPYHNDLHAADVVANVFHLIRRCRLDIVLTPAEQLASLIAAALHDVGHPGLTNRYLRASGHGLAQRFADPILENFHSCCALAMLRRPGTDVFSRLPLSREERDECHRWVVELILATDMEHFDARWEFNCLIDGADDASAPLDLAAHPDQRLTTMKFLLHCADIGNPAKPWDLYKQWVARITTEFYAQGDLERRAGRPISHFMDRNSSPFGFVACQVAFIDNFVAPLYTTLNRFLDKVAASSADSGPDGGNSSERSTDSARAPPDVSNKPATPKRTIIGDHNGIDGTEGGSMPSCADLIAQLKMNKELIHGLKSLTPQLAAAEVGLVLQGGGQAPCTSRSTTEQLPPALKTQKQENDRN